MSKATRRRLIAFGLIITILILGNAAWTLLVTWPDDLPNETLITACGNDDKPAAAEAIKKGADVNAESTLAAGYFPLLIAAKNDDAPIVKLLLDHGANPNVVGDEGVTPMSLAWKPEVKALIAKAILERASRR
jgi:ankyrin repeat protein